MPSSSVLMLGDSSGAYAETTLHKHCGGSSVVNACVSGSTAAEWAQPGVFASRVDEAVGSRAFTHVWLGMGGNDFLDTCGSHPISAIVADVRRVIAMVRAHPNLSKARIFATGYCQATSDVQSMFDECAYTPEALVELNRVWRMVSEEDPSIVFFDTFEDCGGSASAFSPGHLHVDAIHMNKDGYCQLWTRADVQRFLGCVGPASRCNVSPNGGETAGSSDESNPEGGVPWLVVVVASSVAGVAILAAGAYAMRARRLEKNAS